MNASITNQIRVYVYTAVNGFAWQGCDNELAQSLDECLGKGAEALNGVAPLGGIRRGVVGGRNGTAIFRCHIRRHGDFAGRDCKYVALAFFPFELLGKKRYLDYFAVWNHPLLASCLPTSESLDNLVFDLEQDGLLADVKPLDESFWTTAKSGEETAPTAQILDRLGVMFQSRKTELGPFSARINASGDTEGSLSVSWKFSPFPAVIAEVDIAKQARSLRNAGDAPAEEKAKAIAEWEGAIRSLEKLTAADDGPFHDFIGLRRYMESERDDLNGGDPSRKEVEKMVVATVVDIATLVDKLFKNNICGTPEERSAIAYLCEVLNRQRNIVNSYPKPKEDLLQRIKNTTNELQNRILLNIETVEKWRTSEQIASEDAPKGTSNTLVKLANQWRDCKKQLSEIKQKLADKEHERNDEWQPPLEGDSIGQPRDVPPQTEATESPMPPTKSAPESTKSKKSHGAILPRWLWWCVAGVLAVVVLFVVEMLFHWALDSRGDAVEADRSGAVPSSGGGRP